MVASVILLLSMVAVGSQLGTQFLSISTSTDQQVAAGLLNQAMEEVRALPYTFVADGLNPTDSTVTGDSNISISGSTCKTNKSAIWNPAEVIPCSPGNAAQAPFYPHVSTTTVDGETFSVAAYPSIDAADTGSGPPVYRVTVIVSWKSSQLGPKQIAAQTLVFSASNGCLTQTNHPFAAPCQPFLYSTAAAGGGYINVTPVAGSGNPAVSGDSFDSVELLFPSSTTVAEIEQVSSVLGFVQDSVGAVSSGGTVTSSSGTGAQSSVAVDNDPGTVRHTSATATLAQDAGVVELPTAPAGTQNWVSVTPDSADTGSLTATVAASSSPACTDLGGTSQLTSLPCGNSQVTSGAAGASVLMGLYAGAASLGSAPLGKFTAQAAGYPDETFAARYTSSGGSYCTSTSGDGCVHAGSEESLPPVEVGGLPSQFLTDGAQPSGWGTGSGVCPSGAGSNYLLAVVNYSAGASSEAGYTSGSLASPAVSVPVAGSSATPTLCYWNGTGYSAQSVNWTSTAPTAPTLPTVAVTDGTVAGGAVTVTMTPTVQLVPTSKATSGSLPCSTVCTANATVPSLVQADIVYVVSQGGTTLADLEIQLNLGQVSAGTSYQEAP
ncbi:MAG: hypothetical protein KGJ77_04450 [Acidobacteriota bacterium]|nr:hypothetical protein [Acidobacteriota bacterium]